MREDLSNRPMLRSADSITESHPPDCPLAKVPVGFGHDQPIVSKCITTKTPQESWLGLARLHDVVESAEICTNPLSCWGSTHACRKEALVSCKFDLFFITERNPPKCGSGDDENTA